MSTMGSNEPDEETLSRLIEKREKNLKRCKEKILYYTSQVVFAMKIGFSPVYSLLFSSKSLAYSLILVIISGVIWIKS